MEFLKLFYIKDNLITPHISLNEYKCHHCGKLPIIKNYQHYSAILHLFSIFENIRAYYDEPIVITSGYRCPEYQEILRSKGYKAAKYSPHNFGVALDIMGHTIEDTAKLYAYIKKQFPDVRLGYFKYKEHFIHMDVAYLLKPEDIPEPAKPYWHKGARW